MIKPFFSIIITAYQAEPYIRQCLDSAVTQDYPASCFEVIAIDAKSRDMTYAIMSEYGNLYSNVGVNINFEQRKYQTENILLGVQEARQGSICVSLDGDDYLAHDQVLNRLAEVYTTTNCLVTYGRYKHSDNSPIPADAHYKYPAWVIQDNLFRQYERQLYTHLRTWRRELFLAIPDDYLRMGGEYAKNAGDCFFGLSLVEFAGHRQEFINDVLYTYRVDNPLSDGRVAPQEQLDCAAYAKGLAPLRPIPNEFSYLY